MGIFEEVKSIVLIFLFSLDVLGFVILLKLLLSELLELELLLELKGTIFIVI